jgi:hypothetical protein
VTEYGTESEQLAYYPVRHFWLPDSTLVLMSAGRGVSLTKHCSHTCFPFFKVKSITRSRSISTSHFPQNSCWPSSIGCHLEGTFERLSMSQYLKVSEFCGNRVDCQMSGNATYQELDRFDWHRYTPPYEPIKNGIQRSTVNSTSYHRPRVFTGVARRSFLPVRAGQIWVPRRFRRRASRSQQPQSNLRK